MIDISLIYGSDTGMTEEVTHTIVNALNFANIEVKEVHAVGREDFEKNDMILLDFSFG